MRNFEKIGYYVQYNIDLGIFAFDFITDSLDGLLKQIGDDLSESEIDKVQEIVKVVEDTANKVNRNVYDVIYSDEYLTITQLPFTE